jgi:hypothetical protein
LVDLGKQYFAVRVTPALIRWRKMLADIPKGRSAQQGIAECVQGHITIRMRGQALLMGNPDTAEHDVITVSKYVDVESLANPETHGITP